MEQGSKTNKVFNIVKWIFTVILLICSIGALTDKAYISALLFLFGTLLLLPNLSAFWKSKIPIFKNSFVKTGIIFLLFVLGFALNPSVSKVKSNNNNIATSNNRENDNEEIEDFEEDEIRASILDYVKANSNKPIIKNMELLTEYQGVFTGNSKTQWSFTGVLILNENERTALYQPFIGDSIQSGRFLKGSVKEKAIMDYKLNFYFDNQNKVKNVEAIVLNGGSKATWKENDTTDLTKLLLTDKIEKQKKYNEEQFQLAQRDKEKAEQNEKFKTHCISAWDGACPALERYIKENYLKDPDSYEHIETGFWNLGDHAVVLMKYRAKNSFGGYNVEAVKAEVSWDCEVLRIIEYIR